MDLLRHLNLFVTVAEEGHFGRAATRLGITQPPLSQGVQRLEAELGVVLLTRNARMVRLTRAGADLLPAARALLDDAGALRTRAVEHTRPRPRVGVVPQLGAALAASLAAAAGPRSVLVTAPTTQLVDAVEAGQLDVAIVRHPAVLGSLAAGPVVALPTAALVPHDHPAGRPFGELPLAVPPRTHAPAAHDLLLDTLVERGWDPVTVTAADDRAALALVASGQAVALTADPTLTAPGVHRIDVRGLPFWVRPVWRDPPPDTLSTITEVLNG